MIKSVIGIFIQTFYLGPTIIPIEECPHPEGKYAIVVMRPNCDVWYTLTSENEIGRAIMRATGTSGIAIDKQNE